MDHHLQEVCTYVRVSADKQEELFPDSQIGLINPALEIFDGIYDENTYRQNVILVIY